jgi:hypothetical protein
MHPKSQMEADRSGPLAVGMPASVLEPEGAVGSFLKWPLPSMQREQFAKGDFLFKAGDRG